MNKQVSIKRQVCEPLLITQTKNTTKVNSYSEYKMDQLIRLQRKYSRQWQSLEATATELARLEIQVKKTKYADATLTNCDQCVGKDLHLCGKCMIYIGGQIKGSPNAADAIEQGQLRITALDEGQEDAYWL